MVERVVADMMAAVGPEVGAVILGIGGLSLLFLLTAIFMMNRAADAVARAQDLRAHAEAALSEVDRAVRALETARRSQPAFKSVDAPAAAPRLQPSIGVAPARRKVAARSSKKRWSSMAGQEPRRIA